MLVFVKMAFSSGLFLLVLFMQFPCLFPFKFFNIHTQVKRKMSKWKKNEKLKLFFRKSVLLRNKFVTLQPLTSSLNNNVIIFMNFTLFITVLLTAVTLVVAAYVIAKLIGPRSYNPVKGEPFECGIPTRGSSWLPSHIGYYLFAILFLMFDIETVMLYPWAVVVKQFGSMALVSIGFFLLVLVLGLAYAWRKGALEWK